MYALGRGGSRRSINIWPGFVDGLATLLLVVIFVLMVFMVAQFFLSTALTSKDQALSRLEQQVAELGQILALERREVQSLQSEVDSLSEQLYASLADRDRLNQDLATVTEERDSLAAALSQVERVLQDSEASQAEAEAEAARLAALIAEREAELVKVSSDLAEAYTSIDVDKETIEAQLAELAILKSLRDEMTQQLNAVEAALEAREKELEEQGESLATAQAEAKSLAVRLAESEDERGVISLRLSEAERQVAERTQVSEEAQRKVTLLNKQILALRKQLAKLSEALDLAEKRTREQDVQIADLGRKLNLALATKVQELARYRSEFFGELRKVLGNQPGVRVVGDRFVFQSEVLFASGSAELGAEGRSQLSALGKTLKQISARFPEDVDWILRVDGHTDRRPISTAEFASNWELSTSRAISVVRYLVTQGIPSERLAATGFGEFQPIDKGDDEIAFRRNRRIELKLTQR